METQPDLYAETQPDLYGGPEIPAELTPPMREPDIVLPPATHGPSRIPGRSKIDEAIKAIARAHGVEPHDITGPGMFADYVRARFDVCVKLRSFGMSYHSIGKVLNRHHSTVMHAVNKRAKQPGVLFDASAR